MTSNPQTVSYKHKYNVLRLRIIRFFVRNDVLAAIDGKVIPNHCLVSEHNTHVRPVIKPPWLLLSFQNEFECILKIV